MKIFKKNFPLILFLWCTGFMLNAQNAQQTPQHLHSNGTLHEECGSQATSGQIQHMNQTLRERQNYVDNGRAGTIYIPVRQIIIRQTDGTGGITSANLQLAMDELNVAYSVANIQFYECSRAYVNDGDYYDYNRNQEADIAADYEVSNVVNIFHCNTITSGTRSICGYAKFPGGTDRVFMKNSCTLNGSTFIHEFGHYFSAFHTHQGGNELVDGSNCATTGDLNCDTPADPNVSGKVTSSCVYTGTDVDANGDSYTPSTTNFMSYSTKSCRTVFSPGQIARIRYSAINDRGYLTCSCFSYDYIGFHNFGTDITSHNYMTSANTSQTSAYNCDSDAQQLRVGSCSSAPNTGGDFVSVEFDVPAGTDKLRLFLRGGWQNNHSEIHIDGQYQRDFTLSTTSCNYTIIYIYNISNLTQDGKVVIKLVDPEAGCTGDFNIDNMLVYAANCNQSGYAKLPYFTNFNSGVLDNYWLTQSSNEYGRAELSNVNGPYSGAYHLVMDANTNGNYATNQADLRVDLSGCTSPTLYFRWKEFFDETHAEDGVYLSDDGGENFVKVHDLTGAANNTWTGVSLNLATLATANGLSLSEEFIIRFQQYDNFGATTDGIAIDYVYVYGCSNTPSPMIAMANNDQAKGAVLSEYPGAENATNDAFTTSVETIENKTQVDLFPNPANQLISLNFRQFKASEELTIKVVNMLGSVQYTTLHTINNGQSDVLELSVEQLPAGVYTVVIENASTVVTNKPFVIKR